MFEHLDDPTPPLYDADAVDRRIHGHIRRRHRRQAFASLALVAAVATAGTAYSLGQHKSTLNVVTRPGVTLPACTAPACAPGGGGHRSVPGLTEAPTTPPTTLAPIADPPAKPELTHGSSGTCPTQALMAGGPDAVADVEATARAAIASIYSGIDSAGYVITSVKPASAGGFGQIAYGNCGSAVGGATWVVQIYFPAEAPSASMSQGQLFASRFSYGWQVWYRYH